MSSSFTDDPVQQRIQGGSRTRKQDLRVAMCLYVGMSVWLPVYLSVCLSVYLYVCLPSCLTLILTLTLLSVCKHIRVSASICVPVSMSLFVFLCVCTCACLSPTRAVSATGSEASLRVI